MNIVVNAVKSIEASLRFIQQAEAFLTRHNLGSEPSAAPILDKISQLKEGKSEAPELDAWMEQTLPPDSDTWKAWQVDSYMRGTCTLQGLWTNFGEAYLKKFLNQASFKIKSRAPWRDLIPVQEMPPGAVPIYDKDPEVSTFVAPTEEDD